MIHRVPVAACAIALAMVMPATAQPAPPAAASATGGQPGQITITPDQLRWADQPKVARQLVHAEPACHIVTQRLRIPPRTDLPPHGHERGYRLVTVISGDLQLGFGATFDEKALKPLPPGSIFTEPPGHKHFARTGADAVVLQLTEYNGGAPMPGCTPNNAAAAAK